MAAKEEASGEGRAVAGAAQNDYGLLVREQSNRGRERETRRERECGAAVRGGGSGEADE